jgi:hypothetical protein
MKVIILKMTYQLVGEVRNSYHQASIEMIEKAAIDGNKKQYHV